MFMSSILRKLFKENISNYFNPVMKQNPSAAQHISITRCLCELPGCSGKICIKECDDIKEVADIGHGTHYYKTAVYIADKDFNNNTDPQLGVFYPEGIPVQDSIDKTLNLAQTKEMNSNKEMIQNIHNYAQQIKPSNMKPNDYGSNDPTNIN